MLHKEMQRNNQQRSKFGLGRDSYLQDTMSVMESIAPGGQSVQLMLKLISVAVVIATLHNGRRDSGGVRIGWGSGAGAVRQAHIRGQTAPRREKAEHPPHTVIAQRAE